MSSNNQNKGITRKNMIQYLINTNTTKNSGSEYEKSKIIELINNYNNYSKKVIHNIISNILNKESFTEINTIKIIIDTIINNIDNNKKELLYIDTLLFIIDKLFLYGRISSKNTNNSRTIILYHLINNGLNNIPENNNYKCYDTFISYINFYIESFKKNSEIKGRENTPESATGNSNKTLEQTKSNVTPKISLKIEDIKKDNILKIDKEEIEKILPGINKNIEGLIDTIKYKFKKNLNTKNYLFQVLGFVNIVNIKYIILFENYYKIVLKIDIDHLSKLIKYIQIINTNNINSNNILKINKVSQSKFIKEENGKYVIKIGINSYKLEDTFVEANKNNN